MTYASIYKNGKIERFFIKATMQEFNALLKPYYMVTSYDHPRKGSILEMESLFSCEVWQGRQTHGFGYSSSADVYGTLLEIIRKMHKNSLTAEEMAELYKVNTHNEELNLSQELLQRLAQLNNEKAEEMANNY